MKKDHAVNAFFSGFLAAFVSCSTLSKESRVLWGIFLMSRAIDAIYYALLNRKIIKKTKYDYVLIFACISILTGYCYATEPYNNSLKLNKFYHMVTARDEGDLLLC